MPRLYYSLDPAGPQLRYTSCCGSSTVLEYRTRSRGFYPARNRRRIRRLSEKKAGFPSAAAFLPRVNVFGSAVIVFVFATLSVGFPLIPSEIC